MIAVRRPTWSSATSPPSARPAVGGRYHVHSDVGRLSLSRGRARCVQPPHRRLGDGDDLATQLVLDALNMALATRRPKGVIHHSDQGSQYTSIAFGKRCREAGVRPSMGSVGDAYDNAMCESFFATLECELLARRRFKTQAEARMAVFSSSRASTIRADATPRSAISRRSITNDGTRQQRRSRRTPACRRARGRQGQAPSGGRKRRPILTAAARAGRTTCGPGRRNGSAGGRTKESGQQEGRMPSDHDTLSPNTHHSTKPGQVQTGKENGHVEHEPAISDSWFA